MIDDLFKKMLHRTPLSEHEREVLAGTVGQIRDYPARTTLVRMGEPLSQSMLLLEGLVCRYIDMADGRRQLLEIHVPGDFIDLQGFLLKKLEHNMASLSPVRIAHVPHQRLTRLTEEEPHLTRTLWLATLIDAAIHRQWIISNSRRSALSRLAHLLCELHARLEAVGRVQDGTYPLPLTQADLGDATGLTSVHVNRMLKAMRDAGVATMRDGVVAVHDLARLRRLGEFTPGYLYLDGVPDV